MKSLRNFNHSIKKSSAPKTIGRKMTSTLAIIGLLFTTSLPTTAYARPQQEVAQDTVPGGDILRLILGFTTDVTQQIGQSRAQTQAMIQSQNMMRSLAPQSINAKFFPQCQIPVTAPNLPIGYCDNATPDDFGFEMMNNLMEIAVNYEQYYKMMLTPAQNSPFPTGLKCIGDAKTAVLSSMADRQNALQVLIDRINKETQLFRDENARFLKEMDDVNAELNGGNTGTNENKGLSFSNEFSADCRLIIGSDNLTPSAARSGGLLGLQERMRPKHDTAVAYHTRKTNVEGNYDKILQKLTSDLSSKGVNDIINELQNESYLGPNRENYGPITETISRRAQILEQKKSQVEAELKDILGGDFSLPQLNRTFAKDFNRFIQRADDFYRKKFVGDCVTGRSSGVGLSIDQLINSLQSHAKREKGNNYTRYIEKLNAVLASDSHIEDKMAEISSIDNAFNKEVVLTNFRSENSKGGVTPYEFIQQSIAACEAVYVGDQTFSANAPVVAGASSQSEAVQRAKNLMQEFQSDVANFQSKIVGEIEDKMRKCEGQAITPQSCTSADVFNPGSSGFCLTRAAACSSQVQACSARANELISQRQTKLKVAANQFNAAAAALVTKQEQILNDIRNQVLADAEYLKQYFPGSDYIYPEDLFVKMPELSLRNGEMIAGGGEIDFKDLATNIGKLKTQLIAQGDKVGDKIQDYIDDQREQINENRSSWASIASSCSNAAKSAIAARAASDQQQMQSQSESNKDLSSFCRKFRDLASTQHPMAGCNGPFSPENLYKDSLEISAYLDNRVEGAIGDYTAICNQTQNERTKGKERSSSNSDDEGFDLDVACKAGGGDSVKDQLIGEVTDGIPADLAEYEDKIINYLKTGARLPAAVTENRSYFRFLQGIRADFAVSGANRSKEEFLEKLKTYEGADPAKYERLVNNVISGSDDLFCQDIAFKKALEVLDSGKVENEDIKGNKTSSFVNELEKAYKTAGDPYKSIGRSVASTGNKSLTQDWKDIGEAIADDCEAQNNTNRGGGVLGQLLGNPTEGLNLDSLGIPQ